MALARYGWVLALNVGAACAPALARGQTKLDIDRFDATFQKYAKRFFSPAYDWRVFKAQAIAESRMKPNAVSWVGARGLMQLMPSTFKEVQTREPYLESIDDPEWNIAAGVAYDRHIYDHLGHLPDEDEKRRFMFAAYNAGAGTIHRAQRTAAQSGLDPNKWSNIERIAPRVPKWRDDETLGYVSKIFNIIASFTDEGQVVGSATLPKPSRGLLYRPEVPKALTRPLVAPKALTRPLIEPGWRLFPVKPPCPTCPPILR